MALVVNNTVDWKTLRERCLTAVIDPWYSAPLTRSWAVPRAKATQSCGTR
jgi:hypothetical protein